MKKRRLIPVALAAVCVIASIWIATSPSKEFVYGDKTVKAWSWDLFAAPNRQAQDEATAAFKAMGTRALPDLIKLVETRDSFIRRRLFDLGSDIHRRGSA
ncbi:MAG TPA: hypothetical protein VN794_04350, partial [Methylomirabilota bacterium]|nr:hypothetical protein [Methylomirabilota bacterium]